jgi:hypothetical protein
MKRCSLFFLAFVTTLLLAVRSDSFGKDPGPVFKGIDATDPMIASWEKQLKHSRQDHLPMTESAISKKQKP